MSQVTENKVISAPVPMTPLQEFWHYFKRNKGAVVGLVYVVIVLFIAIFANWIAPYNPAEQFRDALLAPPAWQEGGSMAHLLGTDDVGRDVLSRLMYGARLSLLVGCLVVVLSLIMGVILGLIAGYFGGLVDNIIMRVVDIMLALPSLLLALVLVAIFGPSIPPHIASFPSVMRWISTMSFWAMTPCQMSTPISTISCTMGWQMQSAWCI